MARGPLAGPAGPGKFSTRTDGLKFQSDTYGAGVENAANKAGASMARTPDVRGARASEVRAAAEQGGGITPLYAETQRPDEPITAGISMGDGPGPEALGMNNIRNRDNDIVAKYLPALDAMAADPEAPESFRIFVRYIQGNM
jgi:hypothetical protein